MEGINVEATSWNAFDATTAVSFEESEFMTQLLGSYPFSAEQDHDLNSAMPSMYWSDHAAADAYCAPLEYRTYYCESESNVVPTISAEKEEGVVFFAAEAAMAAPSFSFGCLNEETSRNDDDLMVDVHDPKPQSKRKFCMGEFDSPTEDDDQKLKKAKTSSSQVKNPKPKKTKKSIRNADEEESDVVAVNAQGSSSCNSEDDSNVTRNGKTRASRGSATDPQSLYARKRRERINERLRILQNLVPNGTKVDISTMLEEAVQYVKFLQLQIKLLSSDKLWMYAPLAYNGMDIGLDMKISLPKQ